ncbi:hypothetical protein B0H17DRAFT_846661, partial [Mycena rosella]
MAFTLISASRLDCAGYRLTIGNSMCTVESLKSGIIGRISMSNGLYKIPSATNAKAETANASANATSTKLTLTKLHRCLGHISPVAARDIVRLGMVEGVDLDMQSKAEFCEPFARAKATRRPFPKTRATRATSYGERVYADVWGPAQVQTINGKSYYVSYTE